MHKKEQHDEHSHKHNLFLFTQTQTKLSAANTTTTAAPTTNTTTEAVPTKTWDASAQITGISIYQIEWMLGNNPTSGSFEKAMANVFSKFPNEISEKDITDVKAEEGGGWGTAPTHYVTFKVAVPVEKNATETLEKFRDTCCVLKTMLGEQGWRSDMTDLTGGPDSWTIYETMITIEDVATTTKAPTTTTTAAPSGDMFCTTYPATCEVKDSAGTPCVTKFAEYATKEGSQPTCENIEAAGVTKECLPLLVDSKLDFKDTEGKPMVPESDQGIMVAVLSACATGAPIPDIPDDGPDEVLTPIDASVVLTGMTKDQFDANKFAIATAKTMDISEEDITDVKVEEVAASSERRSLTATNLKVTFKVAVKDTIEAKEVRDKLEAAIKDGNKTYETNLKAAGITGFTGIDEKSVTVATEQAPAEATPTPAAPTTTTTKAPATTTTKAPAPATTTTKAPVQTATTKAPVKTVTTAAAQTTTTLKSGAASVGLVATAVAVAAAAMA